MAPTSGMYQDAIRRRLGLIEQRGDIVKNDWLARARVMPPPQMGGGGFSSGITNNYKGGTANSGALVAFGKWLQKKGYRVSEHPAFGGVAYGGHVKGSDHYSGRAIDVNRYPGTSHREQVAIDKIMGASRRYGLKALWRVKNHNNHAHFYF